MRSLLAALTVGLALSSCHQPELPPVGPNPTNPINATGWHTSAVWQSATVAERARSRRMGVVVGEGSGN